MRQIFTRKNCIPIIKDTVLGIGKDDCAYLAASVSFYAFISLFPLCLVGVTTLGWAFSFPSVQTYASSGINYLADVTPKNDTSFEYVVALMRSFMPMDDNWAANELEALAEHVGRNVLISLAVGLWSGRHMFLAMENSLNRIWGIPIKRSWIKRSLLAMGLVAITWLLGIILLLGASFLSIVHSLLSHLIITELWGVSIDQAVFWSWLVSWIIIPLSVSLIFCLIYRLLPSKKIAYSYIVPGSLLVGVTWKFVSYLYLTYAVKFAQASIVYSSMWYIIGLLFWIYVVAFLFLIGAEFIHASEHYELQEWAEARLSCSKKISETMNSMISEIDLADNKDDSAS